MADNSIPIAGGDTYATDDIGGIKYQRVKVTFGADGAASDVALTNPMPVFDPDSVYTGTITTTDIVGGAPAGAGAFINAASTAGSIVSALSPGGDSAWNVQVTGLTSGNLYFEGSLDSTNGTNGNWIALNGRMTGVVNTVLANNASVNGMFRGNTSGLAYFRVRSVGALSGTPAIVIRITNGVGSVFLNASVPPGANSIGAVSVQPATLAVTNLSAANTAGTLTLPAPGAGLFHYITRIRIVNVNPTVTAIAAAASNLAYTSTNLPGSLAWSAGTLLAAGAEKVVVDENLTGPLKSSAANTATTIVGPAIGAGGVVRITAYYYTA